MQGLCRLVGNSADPARALSTASDESHQAVGELETVLAGGNGPVRLDSDGHLVISPLSAEDVPAESVSLKQELTQMLPFAPIVSLLIELDAPAIWTVSLTRAARRPAAQRSSET